MSLLVLLILVLGDELTLAVLVHRVHADLVVAIRVAEGKVAVGVVEEGHPLVLHDDPALLCGCDQVPLKFRGDLGRDLGRGHLRRGGRGDLGGVGGGDLGLEDGKVRLALLRLLGDLDLGRRALQFGLALARLLECALVGDAGLLAGLLEGVIVLADDAHLCRHLVPDGVHEDVPLAGARLVRRRLLLLLDLLRLLLLQLAHGGASHLTAEDEPGLHLLWRGSLQAVHEDSERRGAEVLDLGLKGGEAGKDGGHGGHLCCSGRVTVFRATSAGLDLDGVPLFNFY